MIQAKENRLLLFTHDTVGPPQQIHRCRKCDGALQMNTRDDQGEKLLITSCVNCGNYRERVIQLRPVGNNMAQAKHSVKCSVTECQNGMIPRPGADGLCSECRKLNDRWEKSLKKRPAPFIMMQGVLMRNPARQNKKAASPK